MEICVYSESTHSYCELPDGRMLWGRSQDDVCSCLDLMAQMGEIPSDEHISLDASRNATVMYNR